MAGTLLSFAGRENHQSLGAEVETEQPDAASLFAKTVGYEELIHFRTAESDVAGGQVAAGVAGDQLSLWIQNLHLPHTVMGDIQISGRIEADTVRLIVDLVTLFGR